MGDYISEGKVLLEEATMEELDNDLARELAEKEGNMEAKNWEDTVMTEYESNLAIEEQAEISFKAGKEEGKQEGIKLVVDWIERHDKSTCMDCLCAFDFRDHEWQAFLKEVKK